MPPSTDSRSLAIPVLVTVFANITATVTFDALSVAMSDIATSLGLNATEELWLPDAFLVAVVCATPLAAFMMRRLGVRGLLTWCLGATVVASTLSAFSNNAMALMALLFVQGAATAPVPAATQALVAGTFPPDKRNIGMALWSGATFAGYFLGSYFGGVVSSTFGWHGVFLICVPPGIVALALVRARGMVETESTEGADHRIDATGMVLLVVTLLTATIALNLIGELDRDRIPEIAGLLLVATIAAVFFAINYRRTSDPILDLGTLRDRSLAVAATVSVVTAMFTSGLFEVEMLGSAMGFDARSLGWLTSWRALATLPGAVLGALALKHLGFAKGVTAGLLVLTVGKLGTVVWAPGTSFLNAAWPGVVASVGFGMITTVLAVAAFATVTDDQHPAAASLFVFSAVAGSAIGVAVLDAVRAVLVGVFTSGGASAADAGVSAYHAIFWIQLVATLLLIPLAFVLERPEPRATS